MTYGESKSFSASLCDMMRLSISWSMTTNYNYAKIFFLYSVDGKTWFQIHFLESIVEILTATLRRMQTVLMNIKWPYEIVIKLPLGGDREASVLCILNKGALPALTLLVTLSYFFWLKLKQPLSSYMLWKISSLRIVPGQQMTQKGNDWLMVEFVDKTHSQNMKKWISTLPSQILRHQVRIMEEEGAEQTTKME